jgi:hypothetical protein
VRDVALDLAQRYRRNRQLWGHFRDSLEPTARVSAEAGEDSVTEPTHCTTRWLISTPGLGSELSRQRLLCQRKTLAERLPPLQVLSINNEHLTLTPFTLGRRRPYRRVPQRAVPPRERLKWDRNCHQSGDRATCGSQQKSWNLRLHR